MTAATAVEPLPGPDVRALSARRLVALARSYGPLRAVESHQAPVVRAAAVYDRSVLPRWQRGGDGVHHWCTPTDYGTGRTWVRRALGPVPGATGRVVHGRVEIQARRPHVQWRTREHWIGVVVPAAVRERPEALLTSRGRVLPSTFLLWAATIAQHAHDRTGRRCVVRVDRLAELMEVSKSTVQRCQLAAEALGLYVVVIPGRMLTEEETYRARRQGSRQRGLANDAALVVPAWVEADQIAAPAAPAPSLAPARPRPGEQGRRRLRLVEPVDNCLAGAGTPAPAEGHAECCDTPTRGRYRNPVPSPSTCSLSPRQRSAGETEPPPAARHQQKKQRPPRLAVVDPDRTATPEPPTAATGGRGRRSYDQNALQLARNLADRLSWLRSTRPGRLEPMLRRFTAATLPWTAGDVVAAIDQTNRRLGRASMTAERVKNPPALLASYLRDLDVDADHPRGGAEAFGPAEPVSETRQRNALLLELHREARAGQGAGRSPDFAAATAAAIRADLHARRRATDGHRGPEPQQLGAQPEGPDDASR